MRLASDSTRHSEKESKILKLTENSPLVTLLKVDPRFDTLRQDSRFRSYQGATGGGEGPSGTFLVCGKDRISVYLNETNEYFEIDPSREILNRWKMAMAPLAAARVKGLAVTDKGRVYASLFELQEEGRKATRKPMDYSDCEPNQTNRWANGLL
jgi:hypothetical protein